MLKKQTNNFFAVYLKLKFNLVYILSDNYSSEHCHGSPNTCCGLEGFQIQPPRYLSPSVSPYFPSCCLCFIHIGLFALPEVC